MMMKNGRGIVNMNFLNVISLVVNMGCTKMCLKKCKIDF